MWDDILFKKPARTSSEQLLKNSAMRRAALVSAVCLLVLLVSNATGQSFADNRAQTISNIFQIPIQTLTAISNFAQNTRPLGEILQRRRNPVQQVPQRPSSAAVQYSSVPITSYPRSRAAKIAGLYTASDGSGFRI